MSILWMNTNTKAVLCAWLDAHLMLLRRIQYGFHTLRVGGFEHHVLITDDDARRQRHRLDVLRDFEEARMSGKDTVDQGLRLTRRGVVALDAHRGIVLRESDDVLPTPAEPRGANLEGRRRERCRRGPEVLEELDDAGVAGREFRLHAPGDGEVYHLDQAQWLGEEAHPCRCWLHDMVQPADDPSVHGVSCASSEPE